MYYMPETGLFYNYSRDYDPQTGRYVESDPLGLAGGSYSTYAYVANRPIGWFDEFGLSGWVTIHSSGTSGFGNHSWVSYTPDSASRITGITDSGLSSDSFTFTYDLLDRVKTGSSTNKNRGYTYDANGNRLTTTGTTASTETISTTSNRLSSTSGGIVRTYGYDAAGNTTSFTGETFTFNERGRMATATSSAGETNYVYNALGQLIEKSGNGGTTLLVYDEAGHLLGEYSSTGALVQETIWMGDLPVATLRPNGSAVTIYYVHTDHLGTPRKITNPSGNTLMWRWDPDTFGSVAPSGTLTYNLRFPGQYSLGESGLYYNFFRDYDPQMGRYIESDPIGLNGGSYSTYAYVDGNPISSIDPSGLWASQDGFYVHQRAGYLVFGNQISEAQLSLIADAHQWMDAANHQTAAFAFMHAMRRPGQSAAAACKQTNAFLRDMATDALSAKAAGNMNEALVDFAYALHTMQDSTSPAHQNFQQWSDNESLLDEIEHVGQELFYPGRGSSLDQVTQAAWNAFQSGNVNGFSASCGCH
jgi:RHS repeat-associated protein